MQNWILDERGLSSKDLGYFVAVWGISKALYLPRVRYTNEGTEYGRGKIS